MPSFYIHVSVSDLLVYSPTITPPIFLHKIGGPIVEIYKLLTIGPPILLQEI
jgi:hypothetical protein